MIIRISSDAPLGTIVTTQQRTVWTYVAQQHRPCPALIMLITTVADKYDPMMNMSHGGCYGYVYGHHQTEISVGMAWACMHGMTQQNATTSPAAARGSLRLSGRDRASSSSPGACASVRALQSNIGHMSVGDAGMGEMGS